MKKVILVVLALALTATIANADEVPYRGVDYEIPVAGWTEEELEYSTLECVSTRLDIVRTETASIMLERICYNKVIQDAIDS